MQSPSDEASGAPSGDDAEGSATQAPRYRGESRPAGGEDLIGGKYEIIDPLGQSDVGMSYHARSAVDGREVLLLLLQPTLLVNRAAYTKLVREVEASAEQRHPNLLGHSPLEQAGGASVLAFEWSNGFPLTQLLRARRKLAAPEVLKLLPHLAAGLDFATQAGLTRLNLDLQKILVSFLQTPVDALALASVPVEQWPPFAVKFDPVNLTPSIDIAETWGGGHTLRRGAAEPDDGPEDLAARHVQACAAIIYELCGGSAMLRPALEGDAPHYVPLAALTESGNSVLREALDRSRIFHSVHSFTKAFLAAQQSLAAPEPPPRDISETTVPKRSTAAADEGPSQAYETAPPRRTSQATGVPSDAPGTSRAGETGDSARITSVPSYGARASGPAASGGSRAMLVIGALLAVVGLSAAAFAWWPRLHGPAEAPPARGNSSASSPVASDLEALMQKGQWDEALGTAMARVKAEKSSPVAASELFRRFRLLPYETRAEQMPRLLPTVKEAADLGLAAAIVVLGDDALLRDPAQAFRHYSNARQLGSLDALLEVGQMQMEGIGTPRDEEKAMACFQEAADKGSPDGLASLGGCYLFGPPGLHDLARAVANQRGIGLLRKAEQQSSAQACELLGDCFYGGRGVEQNYQTAADYYRKAIELGNADAFGSLGVLFHAGTGVDKKDDRAGTDLFLKGAQAGSPRCMNFYARALEAGRGVPEADRKSAEAWQKRAAAAGNPQARQWCMSKGLQVP